MLVEEDDTLWLRFVKDPYDQLAVPALSPLSDCPASLDSTGALCELPVDELIRRFLQSRWSEGFLTMHARTLARFDVYGMLEIHSYFRYYKGDRCVSWDRVVDRLIELAVEFECAHRTRIIPRR